MGDIKRKRKLFSRPKKIYDLKRIESEGEVVKKYGLKNRREIWKAKSKVSRFRRQAKSLIGKDLESQQKFFEKLNKIGFNIVGISDVLALTEEDLLNRRLQTVLVKKKMVNSARQARQLIVHKRVLVDGNVVNIPSYSVSRDIENKISLKPMKTKEIKAEESGAEDGKE